jgi:hypothetical protein
MNVKICDKVRRNIYESSQDISWELKLLYVNGVSGADGWKRKIYATCIVSESSKAVFIIKNSPK